MRGHEEKRLLSIIGVSTWIIKQRSFLISFFISVDYPSGFLGKGHSVSGWRKNLGTWNQRLEFSSSSCLLLLIASSATFCSVGTHFQSVGDVLSIISVIRWATNDWYFRASDFIHPSAVWESDQKTTLSKCRLCSCWINAASRVAITALWSSSQATVSNLIGATLFLPWLVWSERRPLLVGGGKPPLRRLEY